MSSTRGTARAARGRLTSAASLRALRRHPWTGVIASVLAVAVVISTVWWLSYDDGVEAQDGSEAPSGQTAVGVAVEECTSTWHAQAAPLEAAAKALEQWQVHVDAMNQLVAGEITLDQANAFWERTRMQAAHKVHRFHTADGTYTAGEHSCRTPDVARNADAGLAALTACRHNIAQRDDTLRAARFAIDTWHHHVTDMDRVRAGTMSPARAVQLWIKYWKQGAAELDDYRSQLRQTDDQNC